MRGLLARYDQAMIGTAYLRVYEPLERFSARERSSWSGGAEQGAAVVAISARRWLVTRSLEGSALGSVDGAFLREHQGRVLACPWRTRLRMLAGILAFREVVPTEVLEAFVPAHEARRAAEELEALSADDPALKSNILHANWHVPLRWFVAFDDSERVLVEDDDGLRIRYETTLRDAQERVARALRILEESWTDEAVTEAVRQLAEWLLDFEPDGVVELDYAGVAAMFSADELVEDRSAADVWDSLGAMAKGDVEAAAEVFARLTARWAAARAREVLN